MSFSECKIRQSSVPVEEKRITELLDEVECNAAFIDTKVVNAIKETENLLQQILAVLGKQ